MARSDVIRGDIERIGSMSDHDFEQKWGGWAYANDRDLGMVRRRWLDDLDHALGFAEEEEYALVELVAAKEVYADDPSQANKDRKAAAVAAVQDIRARERVRRGNRLIGGDAYTNGA
jgi:hypothetical protein